MLLTWWKDCPGTFISNSEVSNQTSRDYSTYSITIDLSCNIQPTSRSQLDFLARERIASSWLADAVEVHAHVAPASFPATRVVHQSHLRHIMLNFPARLVDGILVGEEPGSQLVDEDNPW